jgi:hypothetical protein
MCFDVVARIGTMQFGETMILLGSPTCEIPKSTRTTDGIIRIMLICNFHNIVNGKMKKNMSLVITTAGVASEINFSYNFKLLFKMALEN